MAALDHNFAAQFRVQEYRSLLEHESHVSLRRQSLTGVFVGLNTVFLSGIAFFIVSSHLDSIWDIIVVGIIVIIITPINSFFRTAINRYYKLGDYYGAYIRNIESEFRANLPIDGGYEKIGLFSNLPISQDKLLKKHPEKALANYLFFYVYPAILLIVTVIVGGILLGIFPAFAL